MTLGIHERQTPKVTGVSGRSGVWLPPFRVTRCQRVSPTCPWRGESGANPRGALPLCVCARAGGAGPVCDSVVKRRRSLNTDQVALISLRGGSLANLTVARQTQSLQTDTAAPLLLRLIGRQVLIHTKRSLISCNILYLMRFHSYGMIFQKLIYLIFFPNFQISRCKFCWTL